MLNKFTAAALLFGDCSAEVQTAAERSHALEMVRQQITAPAPDPQTTGRTARWRDANAVRRQQRARRRA